MSKPTNTAKRRPSKIRHDLHEAASLIDGFLRRHGQPETFCRMMSRRDNDIVLVLHQMSLVMAHFAGRELRRRGITKHVREI